MTARADVPTVSGATENIIAASANPVVGKAADELIPQKEERSPPNRMARLVRAPEASLANRDLLAPRERSSRRQRVGFGPLRLTLQTGHSVSTGANPPRP